MATPKTDEDFEEMARTWLRSMPSHGSGPFNESGASYRAKLVPSLAKAFRKAYEQGVKDRGKEHNDFCCDAAYGRDYAKFLP